MAAVQGRAAIEAKVIKIVAEQLGLKEEEVSLTASLSEQAADSLDSVEILMMLEEEFNIQILDEHAEKLNTIKDIVDYVAERLDEQGDE